SGLRLSPLDFARYKEMPPQVRPRGHFAFWGNVPKCPTALGVGMSRNAPGYGRELSSPGKQIGRTANYLRYSRRAATNFHIETPRNKIKCRACQTKYERQECC